VTGRVTRNSAPAGLVIVMVPPSRWTAFMRRHNAYGWMSFSDVLFSDDGLDALVYYNAACGSLCGEAGYAWLHRDSAQSRWLLKKKIISRMA